MNDLPQARMLTRKKLGGFVMSYYRHWGVFAARDRGLECRMQALASKRVSRNAHLIILGIFVKS
jgi:hypothetical protein